MQPRENRSRPAVVSRWLCAGAGACTLIVLLAAAPGSIAWAADPRCSRIAERQGFGPHDYRLRHRTLAKELGVVEQYHFLPRHRRGAMRGDPASWSEMDYTLRAFPNHAPALYLIGFLEQKLSKHYPKQYKKLVATPNYSPANCYFERAMRFAPDDPNVYNAYGRFMSVAKNHEEAISAFEKVVKLTPGTAAVHYNLGLALYAAGEFEKSAKAARKAYKLGYKKTQLRDRLKRKGKW